MLLERPHLDRVAVALLRIRALVGDQDLSGRGGGAQAGGDVDRAADVIVAFEEQHLAGADASAQRRPWARWHPGLDRKRALHERRGQRSRQDAREVDDLQVLERGRHLLGY
jgi:hypothetical protein